MPTLSDLIDGQPMLNLPHPVTKANGDPSDTSKDCTLPLNNDLIGKRIDGPFNQLDRKLWVFLIASAWSDLSKKRIHQIGIADVNRVFRSLGVGRDNSKWIIESAKRLRKSGMDWKDEESEGTVALLSGAERRKATNILLFEFPDLMIGKLINNPRFARLRIHFMIGLSGKYSVPLYELLENIANMQRPVIELSIDQLRDALSVPKEKLTRWVDLNRFAIIPSLQEINNNPVAAGFSATCEPLGTGRKFERVRFTVTKSAARAAEEKTLTQHKKPASAVPTASKISVQFDIDAAMAAIRKNAPGLDAQNVLAEFQNWQKTCETPAKNPMGALIGFARKKHAEMKHLL